MSVASISEDLGDHFAPEDAEQSTLSHSRLLTHTDSDAGLHDVGPGSSTHDDNSGASKNKHLMTIIVGILGIAVYLGVLLLFGFQVRSGTLSAPDVPDPVRLGDVGNLTFQWRPPSVLWHAGGAGALFGTFERATNGTQVLALVDIPSTDASGVAAAVAAGPSLLDPGTWTNRSTGAAVSAEVQACVTWQVWSVEPGPSGSARKKVIVGCNSSRIWRHSWEALLLVVDRTSGEAEWLVGPDSGQRARWIVWAPRPSSSSPRRVAVVVTASTTPDSSASNSSLFPVTASTTPTELWIHDLDHGVSVQVHQEPGAPLGSAWRPGNPGILSWAYEEEIFGVGGVVWWSPDQTRVAFLATDATRVPRYPLQQTPLPAVNESDPLTMLAGISSADLRANVTWVDYPLAGDPISTVVVGVVAVPTSTSEWPSSLSPGWVRPDLEPDGNTSATSSVDLWPINGTGYTTRVSWVSPTALVVEQMDRAQSSRQILLVGTDSDPHASRVLEQPSSADLPSTVPLYSAYVLINGSTTSPSSEARWLNPVTILAPPTCSAGGGGTDIRWFLVLVERNGAGQIDQVWFQPNPKDPSDGYYVTACALTTTNLNESLTGNSGYEAWQVTGLVGLDNDLAGVTVTAASLSRPTERSLRSVTTYAHPQSAAGAGRLCGVWSELEGILDSSTSVFVTLPSDLSYTPPITLPTMAPESSAWVGAAARSKVPEWWVAQPLLRSLSRPGFVPLSLGGGPTWVTALAPSELDSGTCGTADAPAPRMFVVAERPNQLPETYFAVLGELTACTAGMPGCSFETGEQRTAETVAVRLGTLSASAAATEAAWSAPNASVGASAPDMPLHVTWPLQFGCLTLWGEARIPAQALSVIEHRTRRELLAMDDAAVAKLPLLVQSQLRNTAKAGVGGALPSRDRACLVLAPYGGPDSQQAASRWWNLDLHDVLATQLGCIVLHVDNRGTGFRGTEWAQQVYGHLGDLEAADQFLVALAVRALNLPTSGAIPAHSATDPLLILMDELAAQFESGEGCPAPDHLGASSWLPSQTSLRILAGTIDPARIGMWGWSYGGFNTLRTLADQGRVAGWLDALLAGSGDAENGEESNNTEVPSLPPGPWLQAEDSLRSRLAAAASAGGSGNTSGTRPGDFARALAAAVAVAPVTWWRLYDAPYTERYMGPLPTSPDPTSGAAQRYATTSCLAPDNRLGLILSGAHWHAHHGTGDDNVHPVNSLALLNALYEDSAHEALDQDTDALQDHFGMSFFPDRTHSISGNSARAYLVARILRTLSAVATCDAPVNPNPCEDTAP